MNFAVQDWHERFSIQARWTLDLRRHLFQRANLPKNARILEIGCGTGALLGEPSAELLSEPEQQFFGLDLDNNYLRHIHSHAQGIPVVQADGQFAPYANASFDLVFCHFLLLWVKNPQAVILEMKRLARPGGWVCAFAEPDYGGRIDFPDELAQLGAWQEESLRRQGANTRMGRRLGEIFHKAELHDIESGILGAQWRNQAENNYRESEWKIIMADLEPFSAKKELEAIKTSDSLAYQQGSRVLYVPTFYAWGQG